MDIKLLKRTATFDLCIRSTLTTPSPGNLNIPKRSNVFIEQTLREREQCKGKYIDDIISNVLTFCLKFYFCAYRNALTNPTGVANVTNYCNKRTDQFDKTKNYKSIFTYISPSNTVRTINKTCIITISRILF